MTHRQIDTSRMPAQAWVIVGSPPSNERAVSPAITRYQGIKNDSPTASGINTPDSLKSLEERLFHNAAELKEMLSQIIMHLDTDWRTTIFSQLDSLLDHENWQEDSAFIKNSSFMTFLRFILFAGPTELPSLGVGSTGNVLAAWDGENQRIAVEFLPRDEASASFVRQGTRSKEAVVWRGHVGDLKIFIERNDLAGCITQEARHA